MTSEISPVITNKSVTPVLDIYLYVCVKKNGYATTGWVIGDHPVVAQSIRAPSARGSVAPGLLRGSRMASEVIAITNITGWLSEGIPRNTTKRSATEISLSRESILLLPSVR